MTAGVTEPPGASARTAPPASVAREQGETWMARTGLLLLAFATLTFLALALPRASRPLMYDDVNFAQAAQAVAETGLPYGNQGWMSDRGDYSQENQWALWHPPLVVYVLGLLVRLWGSTPMVLRLPGLIAGVATGCLTFALGRTVSAGPTARRNLVGAVAALLALTSPIIVQSAGIVDIDFPFLLPLTLAALLLYLRTEASTRWPWMLPVVATLFWTKMTNPLALVAAMAGWQVARGRLDRALRHTLVIGLGGFLLFGVTWIAVGTALGFPLGMPFAVNAVEWQDSAAIARRAYSSWNDFLSALQPDIIWIGPGLLLLGLLAAGVRCAHLARGWRAAKVDLLLGLALVVLIGYVNKHAGWFPKYQVALVPLLAIVAAPLVVPVANLRRAAVPAVGVAALAGLIVWTMLGDGWAFGLRWLISTPAALALTATVAVGSAVGWFVRLGSRSLPMALASAAVGWGIATGAVMATAPYSTTYWYGSTGMQPAAAWLDAHLARNELYAAPKEVAFIAQDRRYLDIDTVDGYLEGGRPFDGSWNGERLGAIVAPERDGRLADLWQRELPALGYAETSRFGDYAIYESVNPPVSSSPGTSS